MTILYATLTVLHICQLMQADPHKLDFRSDLMARFPGGAGGLGQLGPMGGAMPPTHDLTRPPSLFSATGAWKKNRCILEIVLFMCHSITFLPSYLAFLPVIMIQPFQKLL